MPPGVELVVAYDSSRFIRHAITDVSLTILEAAALVILVIYVFLRSMRATLIPAVAIPVSILGPSPSSTSWVSRSTRSR